MTSVIFDLVPQYAIILKTIYFCFSILHHLIFYSFALSLDLWGRVLHQMFGREGV